MNRKDSGEQERHFSIKKKRTTGHHLKTIATNETITIVINSCICDQCITIGTLPIAMHR